MMEQPQSLTIGMHAPEFTANSTFGPLKMSDFKGSWLVFFSHPGDFTPVCTTEFLAFAQAADTFQGLNTKLLGLSIDSNPSHLAWVQSIYETTGVHIPFPIVADRVGDIARLYGMIAPDVDTQATVRSVFIIDPAQVIRAVMLYPMTNGRSITEIIRLVSALQFSDAHNASTPADWQPGQLGLAGVPATYNQMMERVDDPDLLSLACNEWYWCYKTK
ncbi:MAG: peroxiredoxin [Clostridiales bacterium]|jgi:peroxiredoxin (alkyl hydroperoxide reductase subunit C)|nr:peroxiredoxin [Clostridiales bacterium]